MSEDPKDTELDALNNQLDIQENRIDELLLANNEMVQKNRDLKDELKNVRITLETLIKGLR